MGAGELEWAGVGVVESGLLGSVLEEAKGVGLRQLIILGSGWAEFKRL